MPILLCLILNLPLFIFEFRHGFIQTKSLFGTLTTVGSKSVKFSQTVTYTLRNANRIFRDDAIKVNPWIIPTIILIGIMVLSSWRFLILGWIGLYLIFFSLHPLPLSEYYLNGLSIIWILGAGWILKKLPRSISAIILTIFLGHNLQRFFHTRQTMRDTWREKLSLIL